MGQQGPGVPRIDHVVDIGVSRDPIDVDVRADLRGELFLQRVRIVGLREQLVGRDRHHPLGAHHADLGPGPGQEGVGFIGASVHHVIARAVPLAQYDRELRDGRRRYGVEHLGAVPDDPFLLHLRADHESGHVLEEHERDLERIADIDEASRLVRRVHVQHAARVHRVVRDDPDAPSVDARKRGHDVASPARLQLERAAVVGDRGDHLADVVRLAGIVGNDVEERLVSPRRRIGARLARRSLAAAQREIRQVFANRGEARRVVWYLEIRAAGDLGVHLAPAELFLADVLADDALHQVRAADRHRGGPLHHRDEIRQAGDVRRPRGSRAEHGGDLRNDSGEHDLLAKQISRVGEGADDRRLLGVDREPRARGVDEPDHRHAFSQRQLAQARHLALAHRTDAAAMDGEIVRGDAARPPGDEAGAADHAVRGGGLIGLLRKLSLMRREQPDFDEAAFVEEQLETRPRVELSPLALPLQALVAAHAHRVGSTAAQLLDFVAHRHLAVD